MKKQIFILSMFTLAMLFAGVRVYGQDKPNLGGTAPIVCLKPTEISCIDADEGLNPIPGTEYEYTVDVPSPSNGVFTYHWFVTTDKNFIDDGVLTVNREAIGEAHVAAAGPGYNDPLTGTNTVKITWKSFQHDPANPVFLVIYVENTVTCKTDNIEAYIIEPQHSFILEIANIDNVGGSQDPNYATCVSPIESATASLNGTDYELDMNYGTNYLFYIVSAANYTNSWMPEFRVTGDGIGGAGTRTVEVDWAYPDDSRSDNWVNLAESDGIWSSTTPVEAQGGTTVGEDGECIIVRVTVNNNREETIADALITLAVDGIMFDENDATGDGYSTAALGDLHHEAIGTECPVTDGFTNDEVTQILSPRPNINSVPPTPDPFIPKP